MRHFIGSSLALRSKASKTEFLQYVSNYPYNNLQTIDFVKYDYSSAFGEGIGSCLCKKLEISCKISEPIKAGCHVK